MKYKNAPVSEVLLGIKFQGARFTLDQLMLIATKKVDAYPVSEILPPLSIEQLVDFQMQTDIDPNTTGPFLLRRRTLDKKWLLQIQENMIYLNWIRLDSEPVGKYPGYAAIKDRFFVELDDINKTIGANIMADVVLCDLSYHDRIEWQGLIPNIGKLDEIMNISAPPTYSDEGYNNVFSKFTFHDFSLPGYGVIGINTATSITNTQLLKFESNLRGTPDTKDISSWFDKAHDKQFEIFERSFTDKVRNQWKG